jgi:hypothetical protein
MIGVNDEIPILNLGGLAMGSAGDKARVVAPFRCSVVWTVVTCEGADANAIGGRVKIDRRPRAGDDTNRTDGDFGDIQKPAGLNVQGVPLVWLPPKEAAPPQVQAGEELVVEVVTANGAALAFTVQIVVRRDPESWANLAAQGKARLVTA